MNTLQFLEYLHEHPATAGLAEEITQVFVLRARIAVAPPPTWGARHRIAS